MTSTILTATDCFTYVESPVGRIYLRGDGECVTQLYMPNHRHWAGPDASMKRSDAAFAVAREQLAEYFAGTRQTFDVPLKLLGTPFQQRVWQQLVLIPFGETIHYGELARRVGNVAASRAVGAANGRNPISIFVPCHRVIAADGKLTGYGGGLENKQLMLEMERRVAASRNCLASA